MSNINGINELMNKLRSLGGDVDLVMKESIERQAKFIQGEARDLCPVDFGALRGSIRTEVKQASGVVTGKVFTNMEYAPYVEFGTGQVGENTPVADKYPGDISYKKDKWLVVIPDVGPRWVSGQAAQPFLYPALKNNEEKILENIKTDFQKEIERLCKI
ncbi:HK97-gp10 family putative phage morphogenesis protein [Clostridium culturomicium]|uniref:HK97-gp10 family putative phage morphogenesis protein n=1 Tax=Clostridium culturomicium TaxID=1499683 RepID=UPI0038575152